MVYAWLNIFMVYWDLIIEQVFQPMKSQKHVCWAHVETDNYFDGQPHLVEEYDSGIRS